MAEERNDVRLISEAIDASIDFEELMDSIDFNSYLPEKEETEEIKGSPKYVIYQDMVGRADKIAENIIGKTANKNLNDELIKQLFEAKKNRLEARKQLFQKKEKEIYFDESHNLHKAFESIPLENFKNKAGRSIYEKYNWAKVLFYNEMAICYSGLIESSMSLGYAERSKALLKEINPDIEDPKGEDIQDKKLYTFALFNKGEAERLLGNYELSLKTFKKIVEIYEEDGTEEKPYDYFSASLRMALILIDQGRGKEAIDYLGKAKFRGRTSDYRIQHRELEEASAYIDQKKYKDAFDILKRYINNKEWEDTFTQRKAKVYELRLLIQFKRNLPVNFNNPKEEIEEKIRDKYKQFEKISKDLLNDCVKRYDGDNFKKTCTNLANYFHEENKPKKQLNCYYLYLCSKYILEKLETLKAKGEIIIDWTSKKPSDLKDLITKYEKLINFVKVLKRIDDEPYLKDFFRTYIDSYKNERDTPPDDKEKEIILELKERLIAVYREKDNLTKLGKVEGSYTYYIYEEKRKEFEEDIPKDSVKFIQDCYFKGGLHPEDDQRITFLRPDSILTQMKKNTIDFAEKIVGKTKRFSTDGEFKGILTVLRRWNSFTPALASPVNPSKGGGYFLHFMYKNKSLGIVIDPGYNFLENLFLSGFRIGDINAVVISHAHPDHTDNLPSILSLFHKANSRLRKYYYKNKSKNYKFNKKHLKLILSHGVFDQYHEIIKPSQESLEDIVVVQPDSNPCFEFDEFEDDYAIKIDAFRTSHKDLSQWESLGFIIEIKKDGESIRKIGYTSDARWSKKMYMEFKECNTIIAHLGSIVDILGEKEFCSLCVGCKENGRGKCEKERFKNGKPTEKKLLKQTQEQSHLYLSGLTMFFDELLPKEKDDDNRLELAVVSEFGEELKGGIRMDLYHKFDYWFQKRSNGNARCITGDIGTEIDLLNNKIFCVSCQEFKSKGGISPIAYGKEEAIFFVCGECKSVLSTYQIEKKLKEYCENGRKLELADEKE